jgi:hypothetical protein
VRESSKPVGDFIGFHHRSTVLSRCQDDHRKSSFGIKEQAREVGDPIRPDIGGSCRQSATIRDRSW